MRNMTSPLWHDTLLQSPNSDLCAPVMVAEFISAKLNTARYYGRRNNPLLQEFYLKHALSTLLEAIADPLIALSIRKQCMDQLFKPLLALKRFYRLNHSSQQHFLRLQREACQVCQQFNPFI